MAEEPRDMKSIPLDRASFFSMAFRALAIVTGPVTVLVIASCFSPELQGYFYTFTVILTMQTLLEMGLGTALQQIASHEWARLRFGAKRNLEGDEESLDRLSAVARFGLVWYAVAGLVAVVGFSAGGWLFFSGAESSDAVDWEAPWLMLSILAGLHLFLSPGLALLEGCNEVTPVYCFRFSQGLIARIVLWIGMLSGAGLWALVFERAVAVLLTKLFLVIRYSAFFRDLLCRRAKRERFWRAEIWPLQWRIAVVWIAGFLPSLFIPALFAFQGPVEAGKLGMTWTLCTALMTVAYAFVAPRMPRFAILIARKEFDALDHDFARSMRGNVLIYWAGALAFMAGLAILFGMKFPLAERFLPLLPTGLLLVALFFQQVRHVMGMYLRAHKREPYVAISLIEAAFTAGILFPLGKNYGAMGLAAGFLVVAGIIFVPALTIFRRCKRDWHAPDAD